MSFQDAVSVCFQKYATFEGRARRSEFWYWELFTVLAGIAVGIVGAVLFGHANGFLQTILQLALFLPGLAVSVRRLHDTDRSGWWLLLYFTVIGVIVLLVWYCMEGTQGDNRFGPRTT